MKLRGVVVVVLLTIGVVTVPPAHAASTRAEYIAQVDPICQSFVGPQSNALSSFIKNTKRLGRVAQAAVKSGKFKALLRQIRRTAGALNGYAQIHASMTDQIVAVPAPPSDAGTIGTWVNARRQAEGLARSAASALDRFKFKVFLKRLDQSDAAESAGISAISGIGFQVCGVSV
ncbi:MAG TPA: hypothetical protein VF052_05490 [Solirubrobacterales bacterium]|jgi:hypothetical protein